jgi:hypothetical protein
MKKADNFDTKQWLTENKITTQSRLNEGRFDGWDFDSLVNYLIELADELDKNPQLEKKLDKILYRTIDIENIHDYDEEDIQQAIKQLERLKSSVQK